ncbi:MAG: hypothetical protein WBM44_02345, partial [Waterburya sp.]
DILPPRDVGDSQILDVAEVLGSASPLTLTTLRLLVQRWFSPQAFSPKHEQVQGCPPLPENTKNCASLYLSQSVARVPRVEGTGVLLRSFTCSSFPEQNPIAEFSRCVNR